MLLANPFGAHVDLFGPLYVAALFSAYLTAVVMGYRRGWPLAPWLLVLAAAGLGGVLGTRMLPFALDAVRAILDGGATPEASVRRIPGAIVGALAGAEIARRVLGIRHSILEPLAYSGLVALVIVRVGCLLAGCCFGTPTDLPWGLTYASGAFAHGFHVAEGVVASGATAPHPVHPIPLYDIVFGLGLLALLPRLSRSLRISGNLCWLTVGLYALHRFAQDFVRAREVEVFAGLTSIQLVMGVAAVVTLSALAVSEHRARQRPNAAAAPLAEAPIARLVGLLTGLLLLRIALDGWLTGAESVSLFVRLLPATVAVAVVLWQRTVVPQRRWAATALAASLPLVMGFQVLSPEADSTLRGDNERFGLLAVEAHLGTGQYQEADVCDNDLYRYETAGATLAQITVDPQKEFTREVGISVYGGRQARNYENPIYPDVPDDRDGEPGVSTIAVHPYVRLEHDNIGGHFGLQVGSLTLQGADENDVFPVAPSIGFRFGPRRFHFQGGMLDGPHFGAPSPAYHLGLGTGYLSSTGQEVRFQGGISGSGYYASGTFHDGNIQFEPIGAYFPDASGGDYFHFGARVRYTIPR